MVFPAPPTKRQADEVHRARHAMEVAAFDLLSSKETGSGSGRSDESAVQAVKIAGILQPMAALIVNMLSESLGAQERDVLLADVDPKEVANSVVSDAQDDFERLVKSELSDAQKAALWATSAHSSISNAAAEIINNRLGHGFPSTGSTLKKVWVSRSDTRVRDLHVKLHGRTIPFDADFWRWPHTGERLRWPGDSEAPPDATIGCRCITMLTWATQDEVSSTIRRIVRRTSHR